MTVSGVGIFGVCVGRHVSTSLRWNSGFRLPDQVKKWEQVNPDQVDKVPIKANIVDRTEVLPVEVLAFFMHMLADKPFNAIIFIGSFVFVGLFVIFTLGDSLMTSHSFEPRVEELAPAVAEPTITTVDGAP